MRSWVIFATNSSRRRFSRRSFVTSNNSVMEPSSRLPRENSLNARTSSTLPQIFISSGTSVHSSLMTLYIGVRRGSMSILFPMTVSLNTLSNCSALRFMNVRIPFASEKMTPLDKEPTTDVAGKFSAISAASAPAAVRFIVKRPFPIASTLLIMDSLGY